MKQVAAAAGSAEIHSQVTSTTSTLAGERQAKRDRIIGAALRLFAQQPYQEVTMDSVAKLAGVAKGTLYLYFPSKEALYLGILTDGFEKAAQSYPADLQADVAERLRRAIAVSIQFYDRHRDFLQLLATEEPRIAAARNRLIQEFRQRGFDFFTSLIEEGVSTGLFRQTDSRAAALMITGSIRSILLYYGEIGDVNKVSENLSRTLLEGLLSDGRNSRKPAHSK
jgi:AcrR family transcriptional regulator